MILCEIIEDVCINEENRTVPVYGFRFVSKESGETICTVPDVFTEKEKAEALQERIAQGGIDEAHIFDVIEDALSAE